MSTFDHVPYASGEPTRDPTYPIPPPGEYYATVRWVKELIESTIARVDPGKVSEILNDLLAKWDPNNAMQKVPVASEGCLPTFDRTGQVVPSNVLLTGLEKQIRDAVASVTGKVDKVEGKGLSSNDFTDELMRKLNGLSDAVLKPIDTSLTKSGYPADAAAAGRLIQENKNFISQIQGLLRDSEDNYIPVTGVKNDIATLAESVRSLQAAVQGVSTSSSQVVTKLASLTDGLTDSDTIRKLIDGVIRSVNGKVDQSKLDELKSYVDNAVPNDLVDKITELSDGKVDKATYDELVAAVEEKVDSAAVQDAVQDAVKDELENYVTKDSLAKQSYRTLGDLQVSYKDPITNETVHTQLVTARELEQYLTNMFDNAESSYYPKTVENTNS